MPTPSTTPSSELAPAADNSGLMVVALVLMSVAVLGLGVLLWMQRRSR